MIQSSFVAVRNTLDSAGVREYRRVDLLPDFGIDGDTEAEILFSELECLLAGVANGLLWIDWFGFAEGVEDTFDNSGEFLLAG